MNCRLTDLKNKEVINIKDGTRIGCVNDVEVDIKCARIVSIVVFGRLKCLGLLGRCEDIVIRWENIEVIGDDTILVNCNLNFHHKRRFKVLNKFFQNQ